MYLSTEKHLLLSFGLLHICHAKCNAYSVCGVPYGNLIDFPKHRMEDAVRKSPSVTLYVSFKLTEPMTGHIMSTSISVRLNKCICNQMKIMLI
jgi:hypothetical protein